MPFFTATGYYDFAADSNNVLLHHWYNTGTVVTKTRLLLGSFNGDYVEFVTKRTEDNGSGGQAVTINKLDESSAASSYTCYNRHTTTAPTIEWPWTIAFRFRGVGELSPSFFWFPPPMELISRSNVDSPGFCTVIAYAAAGKAAMTHVWEEV